MPHTASAWKRLRKTEKRRLQNKAAYKKVKVARKAVATALAGADTAAVAKTVSETQAVLDRAADKGYIHKNKAARIKSRLAKKVKAAAAKPAAK
ncbi:30S ribosomal protein S20 [Urbifossiella limnaea]|uniref:Small ribosomal subunit protein bS20 n=1 Tax=Urbifossiella limnaea TaxID=2528023 RepID=A0A517XSQ3_9BACT|nr:30S ribosomal protein S20 [Urbifossiella limnaea]QDU20531.1 30S ribosomal protein S20 [Urbifossiella limnaea]